MLCLLCNLLSKHSKQSLVRVSCLVADEFQLCRANWNVNSSDFQYGPITACCIVQREVSSAYQKGMHYLRYQLGCHSCVVDTRREFWAISNADCWGRKGRGVFSSAGWFIWGKPEGSMDCRVLLLLVVMVTILPVQEFLGN